MVTSPIRKRTVVVAGHTTSVTLEDPFWQALLEIAVERRLSLSRRS
jgi:predicted DNA-binding ribbon-helix-helix protein